jgi:hypothetical protein
MDPREPEAEPCAVPDVAAGSAAAPSRVAGARASAIVLAAGLACLGATAWAALAGERAPRPSLADADRGAVVETVNLFVALSAHLRSAGGDPRFAERLPAGPPVVDELLAEVAYLQRSHRAEAPHLVRLEIRDVRSVGLETAVVRTREFWVTREAGAADRPARSDVVAARYDLRREAAGWRIAAWEVDAGADVGAVPPGER